MFTVPSSKRQPILRWTGGQIHRFHRLSHIETPLWHYGSIHISVLYMMRHTYPKYSSPSIFIHIQYQFTSGQANIPSFFGEISPPESSDVHPTSSSMCCWWRSMKRWTQAPFTASDCGAKSGEPKGPRQNVGNLGKYDVICHYLYVLTCVHIKSY